MSHWIEIRQDKHNHQLAGKYNKIKTYPTYQGLKHLVSKLDFEMMLVRLHF